MVVVVEMVVDRILLSTFLVVNQTVYIDPSNGRRGGPCLVRCRSSPGNMMMIIFLVLNGHHTAAAAPRTSQSNCTMNLLGK